MFRSFPVLPSILLQGWKSGWINYVVLSCRGGSSTFTNDITDYMQRCCSTWKPVVILDICEELICYLVTEAWKQSHQDMNKTNIHNNRRRNRLHSKGDERLNNKFKKLRRIYGYNKIFITLMPEWSQHFSILVPINDFNLSRVCFP